MAETRVVFDEWRPDQPGVTGSLSEAFNVYPVAAGYAPTHTAANYSDAASENLNNVFAAKFSGSVVLFAGGGTKLFKFDPTDLDLDDVSKSGGYITSGRWYFTQFGNTVLAVNNQSKIQAWTVGSSTLFADVAAAAPVAKFITVVRDFVVAANLGGALNANRVQWSDINDETDWVSSAASQSDYQDIPDGGDITGITGGEFGLVLMERAIVRMSYIGSPFFFQFDTISRGLGCMEPNSVAQYNGLTFFLSDDGFYVCDGSNVTPIGNEKVDRHFFENANQSLFDEMSVAIDPIRKLVVWSYTNIFGGKSILYYNWQIRRWSEGETTADRIASAATAGITLEGLDAFGTVDSIETSWDDRLWAGGKLLLAGASDARIVTFTGPRASPNIVTGDLEQGSRSVVTLARPIVDNGSGNVQIASRSLLNEQLTFGSSVAADAEGRCSLRSAGKYHRLKVVPTGDNWSVAVGVDVDIVNQGMR